MRHLQSLLFLIFCIGSITLLVAETETAATTIKAPNQRAEPINQRRAYGNGCGPASLLNAFQYGNEKWLAIFDAIPGNNSRTRINYVVKAWGNKPSEHLKGTQRWNPKAGITLLDLTDMANEMRSAHSHFLPKIKYQVLSQADKESRPHLIHRAHARMAKSLKKGLPPILSIYRYAYRFNQQVGQKSWWPIQAHFILVTELPNQLAKTATSFRIRYIDPYGGFTREGIIQTDTGKFTQCPFPGADLPETAVGKSFLKAGEPTTLALSAIIGIW